MAIFNKQTVGQSTEPNSRRKIQILIVISVISIIFAALLMFSGDKGPTKTQGSSAELTTFNSNLYVFDYPKGWSKSGNLYSIKITPPEDNTDNKDLEYIQVERYGKVSEENSFESIKLREQTDLSGKKLDKVSVEKRITDNKTILIVRSDDEGGSTQKSYVFGKEYIWRITVVAGESTALENSINAISDSLKIKE